MKRAVITSATGAIGIALIKELFKNNIEVLALCRKGSPRNSNIPNHQLVHIDYCNLEDIVNYNNENGLYDVFFHMAWVGTIGAARNDMYLQNLNVKYALDAVRLAKRLGCRRFIGIGSQAEYGVQNKILTPNTPTFPLTGYGIGKLTAGLMTRQLSKQLKLEHVWVRVLSVYGPCDWKNSLIMSTIRKLGNHETPSLTKGEQVWDYLYSGDAAEALRLVAEKGISEKIYVLGSGSAMPLFEYINTIKELIDPNAYLAYGDIPYSKDQIMYLRADISELTKDTGWVSNTVFRDGIKEILKANNN